MHPSRAQYQTAHERRSVADTPSLGIVISMSSKHVIIFFLNKKTKVSMMCSFPRTYYKCVLYVSFNVAYIIVQQKRVHGIIICTLRSGIDILNWVVKFYVSEDLNNFWGRSVRQRTTQLSSKSTPLFKRRGCDSECHTKSQFERDNEFGSSQVTEVTHKNRQVMPSKSPTIKFRH